MRIADLTGGVTGFMSSLFSANQGITSSGDFGWTSSTNQSNPLNYSLSQISNQSFQQLSPETALQVSVFYACVSKISKDLAKLPRDIKKREKDAEGNMIEKLAQNHMLYKLLNERPSDFDNTLPFTFFETIIGWALRYQAGYALITRDDTDLPVSLDMIHPTRVVLEVTKQGNIIFKVASGEGSGEKPVTITKVREEDMFYIHAFGNGQSGIPITEAAKEALGISKAAQQFQAKFFGNGLQVSAVLETPLVLKRDTKDAMKASWKTEFGANGKSQGGIAILDADLKYKAMQMNSTDAELMKTRRFQIAEICRYFDMPLGKVQEDTDSTYNNVENKNIDYNTDTLGPWATKIEQECKMKLLPAQSPFFVEFNRWSLIKGDMKAQGDFYQVLAGGSNTPGLATVNEIRKLAGLNPHEDGNELYVPMNLQDVDLAREAQELDIELQKQQLDLNERNAQLAENPPETEETETAPDDGDSSDQAIDINKFRPMMVHEVSRMVKKESNFINKSTKLDPVEYKNRAHQFYETHLKHMVENFGHIKDYLNSDVNLEELCNDAVHLEKKEGWERIESDFIIETLIATSTEEAEPLARYKDGIYERSNGEIVTIRAGAIIPNEA